MRNLINFIVKYRFFFIFLVLQVIAFVLIFQSSHYHRSFWINSANKITGNINQRFVGVEEYFRLREINEFLINENKALLEQTPYSFLKTDRLVFQKGDTTYKRQFTYINARVINNSVNRRNNYLTLNKGSIHGIEEDMGVITSKGVIGIIRNVSANFSTVISLLHLDVQISAKIKKNNHLGTIQWDSPDYRTVTMTYIPPHVDISKGDTIISSGYSNIFPEGISIGTISDYEMRRGDNFITLNIDLLEDFNSLTYVNVVKNLYRDEIERLQHRSRTQFIDW